MQTRAATRHGVLEPAVAVHGCDLRISAISRFSADEAYRFQLATAANTAPRELRQGAAHTLLGHALAMDPKGQSVNVCEAVRLFRHVVTVGEKLGGERLMFRGAGSRKGVHKQR